MKFRTFFITASLLINTTIAMAVPQIEGDYQCEDYRVSVDWRKTMQIEFGGSSPTMWEGYYVRKDYGIGNLETKATLTTSYVNIFLPEIAVDAANLYFYRDGRILFRDGTSNSVVCERL